MTDGTAWKLVRLVSDTMRQTRTRIASVHMVERWLNDLGLMLLWYKYSNRKPQVMASVLHTRCWGGDSCRSTNIVLRRWYSDVELRLWWDCLLESLRLLYLIGCCGFWKNEMKWVTPTRIPLEDKINKQTMLFILLVPLLMVAIRIYYRCQNRIVYELTFWCTLKGVLRIELPLGQVSVLGNFLLSVIKPVTVSMKQLCFSNTMGLNEFCDCCI